MSGRSSHQRWLAVLAAGGVAAGGVVALTSVASATPGSASTSTPTTTRATGTKIVAADPGGEAIKPLLAETKTLSDEITAARKRLAALGGAGPSTVYVQNTSGLAGQAAALTAERNALAAQAAAMVRQERALQSEARQLAAEAAALGKSKPPTQGGTGASGSGGGDG
jgi:hypothetical protein